MAKTKKIFLIHRILLFTWVALLAAGIFFQWLYIESSSKIINQKKIERVIAQKEAGADKEIQQITKMLLYGRMDSLRMLCLKPLNADYFIYKDSKLIFWNSNELSTEIIDSPEWKYYMSANAHLLVKTYHVNNYTVRGCIILKRNFLYENNELNNEFAPDFNLNKKIGIVDGKSNDKYAIHNADKTKSYLFTLQLPEDEKLYNENWAKIAFGIFLLAVFILFYLYARLPLLFNKASLTWLQFFTASFALLFATALCLKFNIPSTFFQNNFITSFHYASNTLLSTLTHLSFFTFYIISTIYLFAHSVKKDVSPKIRFLNNLFLAALPPVYYIMMFYILIGMVFNSSTDLNVLSVGNLNLTTLWNHFLLLIWGIGYIMLFITTHRIRRKHGSLFKTIITDVIMFTALSVFILIFLKKYAFGAILSYLFLTLILHLPEVNKKLKKSIWLLSIYLAIFALFVVDNSVRMNAEKKLNQYRLLAENSYFNEASQEEKITETMFSDLDKDLKADTLFKRISSYPDSVIIANNYLNEKYLRGHWAKFEMKLISAQRNSEVDKSYQALKNASGCNLDGTHYYKIDQSSNGLEYLGEYNVVRSDSDSINVYLEFYPRSIYKSYSYPDLLIQSPPSIQSKLSLSGARYSHGNLIYSSGKFRYPRSGKWITDQNTDFFIQDFQESRHYIYVPSKYNYMLVSEANIPNALTYILYYLYTYVAFLLICLTSVWIYKSLSQSTKIVYTLSSKLFISFITLMFICFAAIFYVSYGYTQKKYKEKQLEDIGLKRNYIQNALQEKYYWNQKLDSTNTGKLNLDLQDLSYTFQTDINVYDNDGKLVGTSQPAIFSKNLISSLISPKPFFSNNANIDQYEHIGKLEYLAAYSDFYNGEFLPIGYISIPQFLSREEYDTDVKSFLVVISHISLIIIILFTLISIFIGNRLTSPLRIIENRLKDIKVGRENKKIDYKGNDEIGQLVTQYNKTVDELERSAELLAASERESAWRVMARQVAHEINNPLTPMKLTIQQLQRAKKMNNEQFDNYFEKSSATLIEQIENLTRIASSFSTFARLPEPEFERVDVAKNISQVVQLFSNNNENTEITYQGPEDGIFVYADREQLVQVFNNLLKNALQAIPSEKKGKVNVTLNSLGKNILIHFEDNGNGIPKEIKSKLFVPNFTTKSTGMGLGLAISKNIILASKGDITFESRKNSGTVFTIRLPRID